MRPLHTDLRGANVQTSPCTGRPSHVRSSQSTRLAGAATLCCHALHWQAQPREILAVHASGGRCHPLLPCTSQSCADHRGTAPSSHAQHARKRRRRSWQPLLTPPGVSRSPAAPWTVARQAPLSRRFPRQECWRGLPFPSLGDLPAQELKPSLLL